MKSPYARGWRRRLCLAAFVGVIAHVAGAPWSLHAQAEPTTATSEEAENAALRRAAQNPVANMISIPFQNDTLFRYGPDGGVQNVLNIQPVIPFKLNEDWNLITRWVTPVIWQPPVVPGGDREFGLGNIQPSFFLSPAQPGKVIWGVGPVLWLPTATDKSLGVNKWGGGPSAVALTMDGPWVAGVLVNNIWAGSGDEKINQMMVQPFVNYNMKDGWYLTSSPVITANWLADRDNAWTVPLGGGVGRLFRAGKMPINAQVQAFYNVARPDDVGDFSMRFQLQFMLPEK